MSVPALSRSRLQSMRNWQTVAPLEAASQIASGATIAVGWLGDALASALSATFQTTGNPRELTVVYAATQGLDRIHGLNRLAQDNLVRRVIGGQWHPVPALHAMALANRIEAYSLPSGMISRLFRDIAEGLPSHVTRSGVGSFTDPRHGGGKLNRRTREDIVHLVHPAGEEALLVSGFALDVGLIGVGFMAETGAMTMSKEASVIAQAVRKTGGTVIAQLHFVGTLTKLRPGHIIVSDEMIDFLVAADPKDRGLETFSPALAPVRHLSAAQPFA